MGKDHNDHAFRQLDYSCGCKVYLSEPMGEYTFYRHWIGFRLDGMMKWQLYLPCLGFAFDCWLDYQR